MVTVGSLQKYLHEHIPLSKAMGGFLVAVRRLWQFFPLGRYSISD